MLREKYEYNFIKPEVKFVQRFKRISELPTSSQNGYKLRNKRGLYLNPPTWKDLEQYGLPPFETTYDRKLYYFNLKCVFLVFKNPYLN